MPNPVITRAIDRLMSREDLSVEEISAVLTEIMDGNASEVETAGVLIALRTKGETVEEIEGLADTMLGFANAVVPPVPVVDTCGTGGDRSGTFNISTVAALVVAGAGVPVAKHGNRAASSVCGSADLLEALGVRIDLDATGVERCRPRPASRSSSRRCSTPRWVTRVRFAASSASQPSSISLAR